MSVKEIDCLYEVCPIPIIKAMKELKKMKLGDILILHSDHSCVGISIEEWGEKNNYLVKVVELECGYWDIYIQKTN